VETTTADTIAPTPVVERAKLERAKRRVAAIKGFYIHLTVFVLVIAGLFVVDLATGSDWWVHWVLLGWGIGVVAHAFAVFGRAPEIVADWEAKKLKQLMNEP
jgi:fatty acid desaturase